MRWRLNEVFGGKFGAMAAFAEAVDEIASSLLQYKPEHKQQNEDFSWSYICKDLVKLMLKYPTGLTKPIILSELLQTTRPKNRPKPNLRKCAFGKAPPANSHGQGYENGHLSSKNDKISEILETKQVNFNSVLECFVKGVTVIEGSQTKILKLTFEKTFQEISTSTIEMYLHQKISCLENLFKSHQFLMTGLRLHKVQNKGFFRLLPTEYVVPVLDEFKDGDLIDSKYKTLEGIEEEEKFPHYTRNVLLTVRRICPMETIHFPHGESAHRIIIDLVDINGKGIQLFLWDERTAFANVLKEEDQLAIEEPFLINEDGTTAHLEYGPATFFYIIPNFQSTETISSQLQKNSVSHLKRTADGKLDYDSYHHRFTTQDVKSNSINITLLCTVDKVSAKKSFRDGQKAGNFFQMIVRDEIGKVKVQVYDESCLLHDVIYSGQLVMLENVSVDDSRNCFLKTWESGRIYVISTLKGYISSPSLFKLTQDLQMKEKGHYVTIASIAKLVPDLSSCVRVHSACFQPVNESKSNSLSCMRCECSSLNAESSSSHDASGHWKWRYCLKAVLVTRCSNREIECRLTEQLCEELLQMKSADFAGLDERQQNSLLSSRIDRDFIFSISAHVGIPLVNMFATIPTSLLNYLQKV